ncbi:zinc finger domain-containing protein [Trichoderma sp. SZMC 28014]
MRMLTEATTNNNAFIHLRSKHYTIRQLTVHNGLSKLERIGQGFCGSVWGQLEEDSRPSSDRQLVMEREDGGPGRSIAKEYRIHVHVFECLKSLDISQISAIFGVSGITFNVPESEAFIDKEAPGWWKIFILGVDPDEILDNQANKHCLIRPYLDSRRFQPKGERARRLRAYSLRNFPLHMGDMEKIRPKTHDYAITLADALAFLYWAAKVDANDVEFVLAPPRSNSHLHLAIWILDFDCCNDMTMDSGIEKACRCFWRNDPYYPRPGSPHPSDQKLWESFQDRFLTTSERILKDAPLAIKQLPRRLIERNVETRGVYSRG